MRGLYVIRGGVGVPSLAATARADDGEPQADAPDDGRLGTLEVDFSRFDAWYEIDSWWEGRFLERTQKGSFRKTIAERGSQVKVLFNHGFDFHIGDKALGVPEVLEERDESPHLEAGLLDTSYNRDLAPGLRAGAYGSSFMFEVLGESWDREPDTSDYNPEGLPERTITEVRLYEAGPVTWPANPEATAGLRSGMDWFADQLQRRDPDRYDDLVRSFAAFRTLHGLGTPTRAATPQASEPDTPASPPGDRHVDGVTAAARARRLSLIDMARR
jgi:HK97 family phage prohead protease